jgi:AcrR family transcriptional regulator
MARGETDSRIDRMARGETRGQTRAPTTRARERGELSREEIAEVALALADREGVDAVTMRGLARELGVGAMTLYGYFRSKDELMDAAADRAAEEVSLPSREGPWRRQLRALVGEMHRVLQRHPSGFQLRSQRPLISRGVMRTTNAGLAILREAGFDKVRAARAWRCLFVYTFGFAGFNPESVPEETRQEWKARGLTFPPDELPWVVDALPELIETMTGSDPFFHGLDLILDGLAAQLEASGAEEI